MMDEQCDGVTQQKLVDYANQGGKLILAGRMCKEDFDHVPCTILKTALGLAEIKTDPPFTQVLINAFDHTDVPVSFVESYSGEFDDVFATRENGEVVGFVRTMGRGKVMMLGAALTANALDDIDVFKQMAQKMDGPSPFTLSDWMDMRLSRGEKGSFLFVNNYQDDPVETTVDYRGRDLLGGNVVSLPARRGTILPIEWKLSEGITIHYVTSEINEISITDTTVALKTDQKEFSAEFTLNGYYCDGSTLVKDQRVRLHSADGVIVLQKDK